ncbi:MAG: SDR family oxidoreductase [Candidatus Kapabacteria bacterium]|jgi:Tropinone reductase 1|nr:SDR family oxidoreductase [Candidatus Kapabacteria bacterium]
MNERWSLKSKKAVVTGATKGIGRAVAEEFLALGAEVIVSSRNEEDFMQMSEDLKSYGSLLKYIQSDASSADDRNQLLAYVKKEFGGLDILINNAGTNVRKKTMEYTVEEFDFLINTNLKSAFELSRLFYPMLKESDNASIVNISSTSGSSIIKTGAPYACSKAAMSHLSRYLAVEWAEDGIRVNAIEPWYIRTPLTEPVLNDEAKLAQALSRTPMNRVGTADEISGATAFLCMPGASYISGQVIQIDGAATCYLFG